MSDNYTSILFCIRDSGTEIYQNGLPVGTFSIGGIYKPHVITGPDGVERISKVDTGAMHEAAIAAEDCLNHHL